MTLAPNRNLPRGTCGTERITPLLRLVILHFRGLYGAPARQAAAKLAQLHAHWVECLWLTPSRHVDRLAHTLSKRIARTRNVTSEAMVFQRLHWSITFEILSLTSRWPTTERPPETCCLLPLVPVLLPLHDGVCGIWLVELRPESEHASSDIRSCNICECKTWFLGE